VLEGQTTNS